MGHIKSRHNFLVFDSESADFFGRRPKEMPVGLEKQKIFFIFCFFYFFVFVIFIYFKVTTHRTSFLPVGASDTVHASDFLSSAIIRFRTTAGDSYSSLIFFVWKRMYSTLSSCVQQTGNCAAMSRGCFSVEVTSLLLSTLAVE